VVEVPSTLSSSIATGIGLGFIAYVALKLLAGRVTEINAASATIAGAFLLKLVFA
jgi:adenine/guanine/hypoxanthine permease